MKILLLEDQEIALQGLQALLQSTQPSASIDVVTSYDDAIAQIDACPPGGGYDVAFLDVDLKTEKSGVDVLKHFHGTDSGTKVIMLSAEDDRKFILSCIDAGAVGYILKAQKFRSVDGSDVFTNALKVIFSGGVVLPPAAMGREPNSPSVVSVNRSRTTAEALGVKGRLSEALFYLCQGLSNKGIANRMSISEATVRRDYNTKLFEIFNVKSRTELVIEISRQGIIVPTPVS